MPACSTCGLAVEWLRSCYASSWQLFRNRPDVRTPGEYYFSPEITPFYSGRHNLGSATWRDINHPQQVILGEIVGPRSWRHGDLPVVAVRESAIGQADCLQFGESIDDTVPARDLVDGFPPLCVLTVEEEDTNWEEVSSYESCATQRIYAALLVMLYEGDEENIRKTILDWLGPSVVVTFRPHTGLFPGVITMRQGSWLAAVLDGTQNAQELALQAFIFPVGPSNFGAYSSHPFWNAAGNVIYPLLEAAGMTADQRFFICGHSYGAATAYNLLARFRHWRPDRELRYLTFGCPKVGDERLINLIRACDGISIINDSDFVTILPPDRITLEPFFTLFPVPILMLYTEWLRPPHQFLLTIEGEFVAGAVPFLDYFSLLALLLEVFEGRTLDPSIPHRMPEYVGRLQIKCPDEEWPINSETQKDITFPMECLVLNGNKKPRGALIFHGIPIPVPGSSCAVAAAFPADTVYTGTVTGSIGDWWSVPFVVGKTYRITMTLHVGSIVSGFIFQGPDCSSLSIGVALGSTGAPNAVDFSPSVTTNYYLNAFRILGTSTYSVEWEELP